MASPPRTVGQHSEEVRRRAGCTASEIAAFRAEGVIG
jgi:hypothetical protein